MLLPILYCLGLVSRPVPFIPRDGIFKMGRDCAYADYACYKMERSSENVFFSANKRFNSLMVALASKLNDYWFEKKCRPESAQVSN